MLLIDIGNTRAKACMCDNGQLKPCANMAEAIRQTDEIVICSVGPVHPEIENLLSGHKVSRLTTESPEALRFIPDIPKGYGVDRLAADIACVCALPKSYKGTVLVIDAGTCITYDLLSVNNGQAEIMGGTISPGIRLRLEAMHSYTAALPLLPVQGPAPVIGYDTETCMRGGAVNGVCWEIEGYIRTVLLKHPQLRVFLTGGDAPTLSHDLQEITTSDPMMLFRGLSCIFDPQNRA